ncbi:MAG: hypothetical protein ACRYG7_23080 [Janthinobacterium lividum]
MRSQAITPHAQGVAPTAPEQRARLLATLARLDEQAAPAATRYRSYALAPASLDPFHHPATDPARWQVFR